MEFSMAVILEWVAIPFSGGSFRPRDQTWVPCTAGGLFTIWATQAQMIVVSNILKNLRWWTEATKEIVRENSKLHADKWICSLGRSRLALIYGFIVLETESTEAVVSLGYVIEYQLLSLIIQHSFLIRLFYSLPHNLITNFSQPEAKRGSNSYLFQLEKSICKNNWYVVGT